MTKHVCSCCTSGRLTCTSFFLFLFSLALISVGFFIPSVIDKALDDGITDFLALTPEARSSGSQGYVTWADWTDSRAPVVYYSVYTFNLTNPDEVLAGGKPNVTQIGPYIYREYKKKLNTNFSVDEEGHATVKYQDYVYYVYDAERSGSHLNPMTDRIYTINFIFEALKGVLGDAVWIFFDDLTDPHWNDKTRLFHEFIVNDFIWGYNDTLLWEVSCLQKCQTFPGVLTNITEEMIPTILHDTIYTGDGTDPALMRSYVKWQEMDYIGVPIDAPTSPLWNTPAANHVHGTDGTQFARNLVKGQPIVAFVSELYRAATLKNIDGAVNSYKGIDLLHFTLDPMLLANSTVYPPSADYNINGPGGMLHIGRAVQNLPIVLTKPHFLDVGAPVNNLTIGLTPNREIHDTFIDVEPTTGAAMNAAKRLQINIQLENVHYPNWPKTWFEHVNNQTLVPIVWVEEAGALSDSQAHDFKSQVYMAQTARYYVKWVGYIAGLCFAFLSVALFLNAKTRARTETMKSIQSGDDLDRYEPLINPSGYAQ